MAQTFNLTAQINLRGPANIKPIVASIKKQLGGINTNVNIKLDAKAARNIDVINNKLKALNATLIQASSNSQNLASSLASIGAAAQSLNSLNKVNSNLSKVINNVNSSSKALKQASSEMENFGRQSFLALKRFAAISVVTAGIYGLFRAITDGARAFVAFDKELIRLQQITKSGAVGIRELEAEIRRLAVGLGVSSESLTQVAVTLAQAGLSATETKQALEALAKTELAPSFDNITDTTEGAIAAMRQFGISANQLESALGSINAVAAAFAVESGDIISAIQRTGGVFAAASKGVSEGTDALNEFIAVFTSVRATTRESAETIATGLRTIFTRIQRGSTIDFLREFGIELTDIEGKFVGPYEAIKRLSEGLRSLDPRDLRFSKIVEELGGFRQISKVIPLLQQFGDAQKALSVAQGGTGSLAAAQAKAQLSLANQIARVREEFLELVAAFSKSETLQSIFSIVIGLTRGLIKLTSAFKPILPLLAVLGAVKGAGAIAKFGKGFFGNFQKGGGASAAGSTLGQTVTGSSPSTTASPLDAAALNALTQAVTANSGALNSSTTALNSLMTPLSTLTTSVSGLNTSFGLVVTPLSVLDASVNNLDNSIKSLIVKIDNIGGGGTTLNGGGKVLGFARGGVVPGSGNGDTVPAMLQPGEFVIRKKAVETIGSQNLHSMNKYAKGGIAKIKNKKARDGDSWSVDYIPSADPISVTTRGIGYDAYEIDKGQKWEKKLGQIAKERADLQFRDNFEEMSDQTTLFASIQQGKFAQGRPLHSVPDEFRDELITMGVAKPAIKENTATGSGGPTKVQLETLKNNNYNIGNLKPQEFLDGGWVERMQQQKKSSLVNAATQLEYWIDKIYAGTEEVGFSPSFKGGKNPSEQVDFKELQERLAAIDELLNAPVSSAKAKKSGLKSAGGYEPEELLDAVKLYQGGSGPLTRAMANQDFLFIDRKEQYDTEDVVARLQAASQYQTRKKLYSGLGKSQFYETLKDTGLSEDDISDQNKVKSIVGKTIDFPTFLSTSYKKDVATAFVGDPGAMMEISTAKAKTSGIDVNKAKMTSDSGKPTARRLPGIDKIPKEKLFKYDDEDEFILPPNTAFKIKKASTNKITATGDDGEEWDVVMGGSEQSDPLVDLAVQMLNKGGVARYAVGGEVQSAADKLGLGQNDRWWRGSIMGRDSIFDYASPLYAYDAISGEQYKLDQVAVQVFKKKAEKEHLDMVEARQKERQAGGSKVSAEEMATAEAAGDFGAVLRAERDIKSQQASQRAVDSNFRGDFEKRSAGESTFRQKMTPQERRDYYTKRITGYMAGGVTEESDISPNLQQLLDRIAAIGGPKTATELAGYTSGAMNVRKVLNKNALLAGKNIPQAEAIVAKAEEAYKKKQAANQSAIDASNEFALVGAYPLGYSKDYGPEDIGGLSTFFTARGLPSKYQQEIDEIAADVRDLPSRAAERIQMRNIFGAGTKLAFDLDDTLITDADIFKPGSSADPDIPAYSDVDRVTEALQNAKLTRLGEVLRSKLTETPQLLEDIRILTARPQNNAAAIATRLSQLGVLISPDKITGVSGAGNKVDNLSEFETLVDDRLATIEQVTRAGKRAIPYEPIRGYDPTSPSAKKAAQVMEGYAIEGLMERLGVPIVEDDANRAIDYPDGLGAKASIWGVKPNVPTDVKRTMDGDAFGRFRAEIERYYSSNAQRFATGGSVQDTVPALLTPGEFVINKKAAATIGYGKLNKLNKADKLKGYNKGGIVGGIQSFADGGDVRGTQEWVGIVREMSYVADAATSMADFLRGLEDIENDLKAAGKIDLAAQVKSVAVGFATGNFDPLAESLTSSSSGREILEEGAAAGDETSVILNRLAEAIERNINIQELFASSAEEAGVSVQKFTKDVKSQILDKTLSNVSGRQQSRASLRTEFARSKLLDFSDPAKVDKQREALKSSLGGLISDPAQLNKAVNDLITGAQNGSVSLQDIAASSAEVALALNSSIDRQEALNAATTELEDTLGGLTDAARATVDELESFEYGKSGQATKDFGFAGGINPEAALDFKNSSFGGRALGIAKDFQDTAFLDRLPVVGKSVGKLSEALSELDGPIGKAYRAVGGLPGALAAVAVAAGELLPTILEKMGASQSELGAGIGGALSGGGSRAIAFGTLGNQLAGPIGSMIGIIGGAISGALEGFMTGTETKKLENSLNALAKTTDKVAKAFKYLSENNNQINLNNARAANDEIISAQRSLEYQGESSAGEKLARGASGAVVGLTGVGVALYGLSIIGVTVSAPLSAVALGLGAIGAAIYNARGFTSGDNEAFSASLDAATKYVEGLATLSKRRVESFSLEDITESLDNYRNFQENLDQQVRVGDISQQDASIRRQQYFADNAGSGPTLEEAQRSALRRRGYSIDNNQSVADFVDANPGAGTVANDAANAAASTLALDEINRTLGADTTAARNERNRLGRTGLERRGRELAGEQDIQLMQTQNLAIITRELNKETENLNQSYDRALAAITRFNQQLDQLDLDLEYGVGMLTGDGRFGQVDRTQENMLKNMTAYTPEELDPVIQNVVNLAGGTPEAEKLGNSIRANNIIENILPDILRRVENGDIEEVGQQLQAALQSGGISEDSAKALATEVKTSLNNETTGNRQGVSFNELLKDFPAFQATLQSTQKAQEVGIAILEAQNNAYQKVNDNLNKFSNLLKKAEDYERKAADIRLQGALELRRTFGDLISLEDLNAPFNAQVASLGGVGSTDPVAIAEGIRLNRTKAEQIRKELAAPGVGLDADKTKALNLELEELQRGSTNAYEALEKLANDGSNAANALSKIEENRQYGRNVIDFVRRISTQSGADAVEMNRSFEAFNRTLDGSLNFGNVKERRLAYQGMDTILPLIRNTAFGRQAEADFNINMLQGMGVKVDDPNAFGSGQTLRELIQSGTNGVDANTTALIEQYRKSIEVQAIAAVQLANLNREAAYLKVLPKIEIILLSLAQQLPSIIADAMLGNNITLPDNIVTLNNDADAAEAESRRISTTQAALLQAINEWEVATLEGTPLRGDEAANITRLYDELGWTARITQGPYQGAAFPNAMQDIEQQRIAAMERAQTARATATRATDDYTNEQRLQRDINRQDLFNPTTINAMAEANGAMALQDATRDAEEARNRVAAAAADIPVNPAAPAAGARVPPAAVPAPAPAPAAAAPAAVVNPAIFDRLAATLPQIDMQMLNVVNSMTVLSNGVIKLDATIALLQTELARDNGFSQSVTNFTETTRTFGGHVDTFTRKIDTFGTYVDKLDKAVGSLSNATITMGGNYTVDVRVSGAAAFTAIEDKTKDLINKEIDLAMGEMVAKINRATGFNLDLNRRT